MSREEDAFLKEIRRDPLATLPRLVFADWLEQRGDFRGELIRMQVEDDENPFAPPPGRRFAAMRKQAVQYYREKYSVPDFVRFDIYQGTPEMLVCSSLPEYLELASTAHEYLPISRLVISGDKLEAGASETTPWENMRYLKRLVGLVIRCDGQPHWFDEEHSPFEGLIRSYDLSELDEMRVLGALLPASRVRTLAENLAFFKLRTLELAYITSVEALFRSPCYLKALQELSLPMISPYTAEGLQGLFPDRPINTSILCILQWPELLANLSTLRIPNSRIKASGLEALLSCPALQKLQNLDVAGCQLGYDGVRMLAELPSDHDLQRVRISLEPSLDFLRGPLRERFGSGLSLVV